MAASALLVAAAGLGGASAPGSVDADLTGLRSVKGVVHACLTTKPDRFPDCQSDPRSRRITVATASAQQLRFGDLPTGDYAIALIHDENGNGRLDTVMGIPREGFGFSRNPALGFGPPKFRAAQFAVKNEPVDEMIKVKYLL